MSQTYTLNNGTKIPSIGFGVWKTPPNITDTVVELALGFGYRHIDTAKAYENEKEAADAIAKFLKENKDVSREDIFYTTKIFTDDFGHEKTKKAIEKALEAASSIGYIDLLLLHAPERPATARLGAYKALQEAVEEGKVKNIGVSNYGVSHLKELFEWPEFKIKPVVNQIQINPWLQHNDIVDYCAKNDILIESYSPLLRGDGLNKPELVDLAKKYKVDSAQILIRWNLQKGYLPLPKSATASRIKSNFTAYDFELSQEDVDTLGDKNAYELAEGTAWDPTKWD
ncbi:aldo-keto reductase superfamily protein [Sugiyamaella lignohabitans]|uniref:Aldo-keto reductase superfamily protein n=1 Tax=Sugiyamaella lignohabitans TaxID=796027 RepID=A0A167D436_9ASCO|nr:aldo-keto reductase superfamily protein [Sugiyamaella lignohabitans]ANB12453.1 aldo-keto reductase superfamily protein [Sugiyamaella lignohabitans]